MQRSKIRQQSTTTRYCGIQCTYIHVRLFYTYVNVQICISNSTENGDINSYLYLSILVHTLIKSTPMYKYFSLFCPSRLSSQHKLSLSLINKQTTNQPMSGNASSSTSKPSSSTPARNTSSEGKRDGVDKLRTAVGAVSTARKLKAAASSSSSSNSKKQQQTKEEDRSS